LRGGSPPEEARERIDEFNQMIVGLNEKRKLDDFIIAISWFHMGPHLELTAPGGLEIDCLRQAIDRYGTKGAKEAFDAASSIHPERRGTEIAQETIGHLKSEVVWPVAAKGAIEALSKAEQGLMLFPNAGFIVRDNPRPQDVVRFKAFLGSMHEEGMLGTLRKAAEEEQANHLSSSWAGPARCMRALVEKYGTDAQKQAYGS
jgi:hypothetical protein